MGLPHLSYSKIDTRKSKVALKIIEKEVRIVKYSRYGKEQRTDLHTAEKYKVLNINLLLRINAIK